VKARHPLHAPAFIALFTMVGLTAALIWGKPLHWLSWIALLVPIAVVAGCLRSPGRRPRGG
jgi:hypothetical protein